MKTGSARISPTAHYTGYTWFKYGLSHTALATPAGRWMHAALRPPNLVAKALGAPTLDGVLLARHCLIDLLLGRAIEEGRIGQVIEVAAGLSPRGWRFKQRFGERIRYVEADLPDMAQYKRALLARAGLLRAGHEVMALDALADGGPLSLATLADALDATQGTAIVTEGLLNYFDTAAVLGMWRRFSGVLARFPDGLYLSDIHLMHGHQNTVTQAFIQALSIFVKGQVHLHFDDEAKAATALREAGFGTAEVLQPWRFESQLAVPPGPGAKLVRVIQARTAASRG